MLGATGAEIFNACTLRQCHWDGPGRGWQGKGLKARLKVFESMDWFKGKITGKHRKTLYLMGQSMVSCGFSMVSCRFSLKPIHCLKGCFEWRIWAVTMFHQD
jgi:hypothetical protein